MTKFFFKFKKPIFGPSPQFLGQQKFFKKNQVVKHNFIRFSSTLGKIQRNLMIKFQENTQTDIRREGWTDTIS